MEISNIIKLILKYKILLGVSIILTLLLCLYKCSIYSSRVVSNKVETIISDDLNETLYPISVIEPVNISFDHNDSRVLTRNFLDSENGGRWTINKHAAIKFLIKGNHNDINLKISGVPFFGPNFKHQEVDIYANGDFVKTWKFDKTTRLPNEIDFIVPKEKITNHQLEIGFVINNPKSPKELGINEDVRLIGLGVQNIMIKGGIEDTVDNNILKPVDIQLEFITKKHKKNNLIEILIDGEKRDIKPVNVLNGNGVKDQKDERYLVNLKGTQATVEVVATNECNYCQLKFSIFAPKVIPQNKFHENIIKIIELRENNLTLINPKNPNFISDNKAYWVSTQYLKGNNDTMIIDLRWTGLE